jgi:hypothetical protein
MKKAIFILILAILAGNIRVASGSTFKTSDGTKIELQSNSQKNEAARKYLTVADRIISGYLRYRSGTAKLKCRIIVLDKKLKGGFAILPVGKNISIYLNADAIVKRDNGITDRKLLSALSLIKCGITPDEENEVKLPEWYIAGLRGSIRHKMKGSNMSPVAYMPAMLAAVRSGNIPSLDKLISNPLSPTDGTAYLIYEEYCRFLLGEVHRLSRSSDNAPADLVVMSASGQYSADRIFSSSAGRVILKKVNRMLKDTPNAINFSDREKMQFWFKIAINMKFKNYFFPLPGKTIAGKMKYFYNIPCLVKTGRSKTKKTTTKIYDIPKEKYLMVKPDIVVFNTAKKLSELANASPAPIQKKLLHLHRLLAKTLTKPDRQQAAKKLYESLEAVEKAIAKQIEIEKILYDIEISRIPPGVRMKKDFEADRKNPRDPSPELRKYLDSIENRYHQK